MGALMYNFYLNEYENRIYTQNQQDICDIIYFPKTKRLLVTDKTTIITVYTFSPGQTLAFY